MPVASANDYATEIKRLQSEQAKVADWEDIFQNMLLSSWGAASKSYLSQEQNVLGAYREGEELLQKEAEANISDAYTNYIASQLQLKHATDLTTGYKNRLNVDISEAYKNSLYQTNQALVESTNQLKQKQMEDLSKLDSSKLTDFLKTQKSVTDYKDTVEKEITKQANRMVGYDADLLKFAHSKYGEEYADLFDTDASGKLIGWSQYAKDLIFDTHTDSSGKIYNQLNSSGQGLYSDLLQNGFSDWAAINYSPEKYSNWLDSDQQLFNTMIFDKALNPYGQTFNGSEAFGKDSVSTLSSQARTNYMKSTYGENVVNVSKIEELSKSDKKQIFSNKNIKDAFTSDNNKKYWYEQSPPNHPGSWAMESKRSLTDEGQQKLNSIEATVLKLKESGNISAGDVIELSDGILAYYDGKDFRFASVSDDIKTRLRIK